MNPKAEGALEALSWVLWLLENYKLSYAIKEIKSIRESLLKGIAIDFKHKISYS